MSRKGLGRLGAPAFLEWYGNAGSTYEGRANAKWTPKTLGVDRNGFYWTDTPFKAKDLVVYRNGVLQREGTADRPQDYRVVHDNFSDLYWIFEEGHEPGDNDIVSTVG